VCRPTSTHFLCKTCPSDCTGPKSIDCGYIDDRHPLTLLRGTRLQCRDIPRAENRPRAAGTRSRSTPPPAQLGVAQSSLVLRNQVSALNKRRHRGRPQTQRRRWTYPIRGPCGGPHCPRRALARQSRCAIRDMRLGRDDSLDLLLGEKPVIERMAPIKVALLSPEVCRFSDHAMPFRLGRRIERGPNPDLTL
jgi:hypothetical protein